MVSFGQVFNLLQQHYGICVIIIYIVINYWYSDNPLHPGILLLLL